MEFNGTFLATIITFVVFVFLMNKVLYAPILGIMEQRKTFIDDNYKSAADNDSKATALVEEKEKMLLSTKETAREKYNEALNTYKERKAEILSEAQSSAVEEIQHSEIELKALSDEVKNGLKSSMTDLANDIVEKVIGYRSEVQGFDDDAVNKVLWDK